MNLPETPVGGATIGKGRPQPKGRPAGPGEIICPRCSLSPCQCGDALAEAVHHFTYAGGIPLPLRMCHRLAAALRETYTIEPKEKP